MLFSFSCLPLPETKIYFMRVKINFDFWEHKKEKLFSPEKEKIFSGVLRLFVGLRTFVPDVITEE